MNHTYLFFNLFWMKNFYHFVDRNDWFEFSKSVGHSTRQRLNAFRLDRNGFERSFCFHNFLTFPNLIKCSGEIDKQLLWHFPCRNWVLVAIKSQRTVYHQRYDFLGDNSWAKGHCEFRRSARKSLASHLKYRCWTFKEIFTWYRGRFFILEFDEGEHWTQAFDFRRELSFVGQL